MATPVKGGKKGALCSADGLGKNKTLNVDMGFLPQISYLPWGIEFYKVETHFHMFLKVLWRQCVQAIFWFTRFC